MADVIDLITRDHREVEDLFAQFASTHDRSIAAAICEELERHTFGEEQTVYPVVAESLRDGERLASEAEGEHREARQLIGRIRRTTDPRQLNELMGKLETAVQHHVEEEERGLLPQLGEAVDEQRRLALGDAFAEAKQHVSV